MTIAVLHRHDRVWLSPTTEGAVAAGADDPRIVRWIAAGRALVVRRRDERIRPDAVALGVALPLAEFRARIAVIVDRRAIVRTAGPLSLDDVIAFAPLARRAALAVLVARGAAVGTAFMVYGSFAWQAISGAACVTPDSDLDLLWEARDPGQAERTVALLLDWERGSDLRADGELRLPCGDCVAWRELVAAPGRLDERSGGLVLVKRDDGIALRRVSHLFSDDPG